MEMRDGWREDHFPFAVSSFSFVIAALGDSGVDK
jgi:hypothetical protein